MQFKIYQEKRKSMERKRDLLKPKIDVVFHSLFRVGNEDITKAIITAITKEKIDKIELENDRHIIGKYTEEKMGILDLKAILDNGTICDIEIQLVDNKDTEKRFLWYWSKLYSEQLIRGEEYKKLNKVIGIIILDYKLKKTREIKRLNTKWKIKEVLSSKNIELTDDLEIHIIEIPKVKEMLERNEEDELAQWITFLDNPNRVEELKIMESNKEIKKAMEELEEISQDKELRRIAELKDKYIRDEKNMLSHALEDLQIEITKELLKTNMSIEQISDVTKLNKQKIVEMEKNGNYKKLRRIAELEDKAIRDEKNMLSHAREDVQIEIASKLLKMSMSIKKISEVTGLDEKEIIKLKNNM